MVSMLTDTQITPVQAQSRRDISVSPGDTVRVHQKITEKDKTRIQVFEGVVIARKHGNEAGATFTVRRVGSDGVAVEKIFPLYSPMIDRIEVTRRTKVRRSRLYFLRDKTPKQIREKLRRTKIVSETTGVPGTDSPADTPEAADTSGAEPTATINTTADTAQSAAAGTSGAESTATANTSADTAQSTAADTDTEPATDTNIPNEYRRGYYHRDPQNQPRPKGRPHRGHLTNPTGSHADTQSRTAPQILR